MKILITDGLSDQGQKMLREAGLDFHIEHFDPQTLLKVIPDYEAILVRSATTVTREVIEAGRKLRAIARGGAGIDNIDHVYAASRGIPVLNTPGANSASVAELVLAHLFALARFLPASKLSLPEGRWEKKSYKGFELEGRTLGIVGFGKIGQILASKALALGMKVLAFDVADIKTDLPLEFTSFEDLLRRSDAVSLHVPRQSKALIGVDELAMMKTGAVLINCARGGVVDEDAVLHALNSGKLWGLGTDVFTEEPIRNLELAAHPRVSATPHIGASTEEAQDRVGTAIAAKLIQTLQP